MEELKKMLEQLDADLTGLIEKCQTVEELEKVKQFIFGRKNGILKHIERILWSKYVHLPRTSGSTGQNISTASMGVTKTGEVSTSIAIPGCYNTFSNEV